MSMNNTHKKDINKRTNIDNATVTRSIEYVYYILKKVEKIASALHLITGAMSDREPLKITIRQKSIELIDIVSNIGTDLIFTKKDTIISQVEYIKSLVHVGKMSGHISLMNSEIVLRELDNLLEFLHGEKENSESKMTNMSTLPQNFFTVSETEVVPEYRLREMSYLKEGVTDSSQGYGVVKNEERRSERGGSIKDKNVLYARPKSSDSMGATIKPRKKGRRDFILNFISKQKNVSIKDISDAFDGCSEKTIQRELMALIKEGKLVKEGERRWSRYRLA